MAKHITTVKATVNYWTVNFFRINSNGELEENNRVIREMRDNKGSARQALKREWGIDNVIINHWEKVSVTYEMPIDDFIAHATVTE